MSYIKKLIKYKSWLLTLTEIQAEYKGRTIENIINNINAIIDYYEHERH